MKKRISLLVVLLLSVSLFGGCAMMTPMYYTGGVYASFKAPVTATSNAEWSKVGTATASSILGIFAMGDASITTAMKNANINKIHHIDYEVTNILALYATYTIYVYGD